MSDRQLTVQPKRVSFLLKFAFGFLFNSFSYEYADYLGRASYTFEFGSVVVIGTVFGIAWVLFGRFAERSPLSAVLIGALMPLAVPLLTIVGFIGIYFVILFWYVFIPISVLNGIAIFSVSKLQSICSK
jgi:glucan phosphoethanolaminetransferase (alkaline phosphatase superfamily)